MGIPDSVVIAEDRSNNTADNARYAKQLLDSLHLDTSCLLITSAVHMPRAALIFKKAGIPVVPFPCNYTDGRGSTSFWDFLPKPSVLPAWGPYLKETAGYLWYRVK